MAENTVLYIKLILNEKCNICKKQGISMNSSNQNRLDFITSLQSDLYFIDLQSLKIETMIIKNTIKETKTTRDSTIHS